MRDHQDINKALRSAVLDSYGCVAAEVWVYNDRKGMLEIPDGGFWCDPHYEQKDKLKRLEDKSHPKYVPSTPTLPGTDLSGMLWTEGNKPKRDTKVSTRFKSERNVMPGRSRRGLVHQEATHDVFDHLHKTSDAHIRWRDIKSLIDDPDTQTSSRLSLCYDAGLSLAVGILFDSDGIEGVMIYLARGTVDMLKVSSHENIHYLQCATSFIGAVVAVKEATKATLKLRGKNNAKAWSRVAASMAGKPVKTAPEKNPKKDIEAQISLEGKQSDLKIFFNQFLEKFKGGQMQTPPPFSWYESTYAMVGTFIGILILSLLNEGLKKSAWGEYAFGIAPFAAIVAMQFSLTQAPAAQPRSIVYSEFLAGAIALPLTVISESTVPLWLRSAIIPAIVVGVMARCGVVHPPAAAQAALYAAGAMNRKTWAMVMLACFVTFPPAMIINNLNKKRQYPTFWVSTSTRYFFHLQYDRINNLVKKMNNQEEPKK